MSNSEFLQTSWHYDKESNRDVAKVCFVFDDATNIDPYASADDHEKAMANAVDACSNLVSDVAASFGRQAHLAALRFMRWLIAQELGAENNHDEVLFRKVRNEFVDIMEMI